MLEQNFIGPVLRRNQVSPVADWGTKVAADLLRPRYKLGWHQAVRIRLMKNYWPMFALLLACWIIKLEYLYFQAERPTVAEFLWKRSKLGDMPIWGSIVIVIALYGYLIGVIAMARTTATSESEYWKENLGEIRDFDR